MTGPVCAPRATMDCRRDAFRSSRRPLATGSRCGKRSVGSRDRAWCGNALAGDLQAVPVLIGLGVDELSVAVPIVPAVKARVRSLVLNECKETARHALDAADAAEVRAIVARRHT
jgi:multiphosphoryl transfer protein